MSKVFKIIGTIETPSNHNEDSILDMIVDFMEEKGFLFGGSLYFMENHETDEENKKEGKEMKVKK